MYEKAKHKLTALYLADKIVTGVHYISSDHLGCAIFIPSRDLNLGLRLSFCLNLTDDN